MSQKSGMGFIYIMFILFVGLFTLVILTDGGIAGNGNAVSKQGEKVGLLQRPVLDLVVCNGSIENPRFEPTRMSLDTACTIYRDSCEGGIFGQFGFAAIPIIAILKGTALVGGAGLTWASLTDNDEGYITMQVSDSEAVIIGQYNIAESLTSSGAKQNAQPFEGEICVPTKANSYDFTLSNYDKKDVYLNGISRTIGS